LAACVARSQELLDAVAYPVFIRDDRGTWIGYNAAFAGSVLGASDEPLPQPEDLGLDFPLGEEPLSSSSGDKVQVVSQDVILSIDGDRGYPALLSRTRVGGSDGRPVGELGVLEYGGNPPPAPPEFSDSDEVRPALAGVQQRAAQLEAVLQVSRVASSVLSLDTLLPRSVELIRERFDFYYVGIFLIDQAGEWAWLRAGTGDAGKAMIAEGHRLRVGGDSMIGTCVADVEAQISLDVGEVQSRFDNPHLPETRSEMALPLIWRGSVVGAMTVQSTALDAFSQKDVEVLQAMADQLTVAIQNARLFDQMDAAVRENETLYSVSLAINEATSVEDLLRAMIHVAGFLGMDSVSIRHFERWSADDVPPVVAAHGATSRSGSIEYFHETEYQFNPTIYEWLFDGSDQIFAFEDLQDPSIDVPEPMLSPLLAHGNRCLIVASLNVHGHSQGVVALYGPKPLVDLPDRYVQVFTRTLVDQVSSVLDRQLLQDELEQRASRLALVSDISQTASSYLDQSRLLDEVVTLIRERFGLLYVGIYLVDDSQQWAVLRTAAGETSARLEVGDTRVDLEEGSSRISTCLASGEAVNILDLGEPTAGIDEDTQALPRSEAVLPLVGGGERLGVIVIQSDRPAAFSEDDITILSTMADQLANAIINARLYAQSQQNLEELQRVQRRYALDQLERYQVQEDVIGYSYNLDEVAPLASFEQLSLSDVEPDMLPIVNPGVEGGDGAALIDRLELRNEVVGLMSFEEPGSTMEWSEDQLSVLEAVREQLGLALENRLLIDQSQRSLSEARQREAELGFLQEIAATLNATNDLVASSEALMANLQSLVPVNHFVLATYDASSESQLTFLTGAGEAADALGAMDPEVFNADTGLAYTAAVDDVIVTDDLRFSTEFREDEALAGADVFSRVMLPLDLGVRTLGAMSLGSDQVDAFDDPGVLRILQQVAAQVASAMERGNLLRIAQSSATESQQLYEVTSDLAEAVDSESILDAIARHAFPSVPACAEIMVFIADPETGAEDDWLEVVASLSQQTEVSAMPVGDRVDAQAYPALKLLGDPDRLHPQRLFVCEDVGEDPRLDESIRAHYLAQGVRGLVIAELATGVAAGERIGFIQVRLSESYTLSESETRLYETIADQAAVVLSNRRLFRESQAQVERQAVAVDLANLTTSISERDRLLDESVNFLKSRFDLYYAGIFLLDDRSEWAVLQSGTGKIGERLLLMGHRLAVRGQSMVSECIRTGTRVLALDIDAEAAELENPLLPETRSAVVFPLVSRGQVNGAITLQSDRRFAFTQEDVGTLSLMINQLANVIETTNLYERSQSSLAETRMLYRIAQQITDARDTEAVLSAAVEGMAQRSEPDWVVAGLFEPRTHPTELRIVVEWNREGRSMQTKAHPLDRIPQFYDMLRVDEQFITPDITQDPMVDEYLSQIYMDHGIRATAAFQLAVRGVQYGLIMVHCQNAREFSTAELSFYENVARQAFVALENINLVVATQEQADRRDILNQVLQTASSSLDQVSIMQEVGEVVAERLTMPVMMWQWDEVMIHATSVHDEHGHMLIQEDDELNFSSDELMEIYDVVETRTPKSLDFQSRDRRLWRQLEADIQTELVEGYAVPLAARDVVYGVAVLSRQRGHDPIDDLEREFMQTVGANVSVALETASLYQEAQETAERLREVDELKNQFMANMSHELRTPLNSIIGFSRVMLKGIDGPLSDMQETDLQAIYDSGRHLLELINDILDISKINAGKMEISFEPVDLASMIESVMSTALGFVKDKPIKLRTDVPEGLPTVIADGRRVRQVLTNLLGNAGKFTEEGYIKIAATYDDYQVIINVEDTGIGIPPERIHAVFEQFEQVDSSSTRRYGGTGLGVPLSREFVRMHGGDMWIQESIVGKGTTFSFSLPIGGPDAAVGEPGGPPDAQTILAVDDDEGVITLFRRYLEDEGYRVFGLTKGERVVEEAKRLKPYAITLDVMMPEEDGWSVIRRLKADPETRDIPVIICSILSDRDKGLSMGVADYLVKPISEHDLLDALDRVEISQEGHVLVVDDNADDRKLLRRILENGAIEVMEAEGGQAAIELIHDDPPELVVLDLMMPDVDGFAVLEHLKSDQETRQIPVIVVTAKELTPEMRARLQQRVESLLQKGIFDQEQLLADVSDALHRLSVTHKDQVPD
jgi:signal transduction histidine kinase/DNA-binding response OmpR family regulator/putative methionine-R-sulfoxide reductase with GAF domain